MNLSMEKTIIAAPDGAQITLCRQECLAGMRQNLGDASVDLVVTSPPYNIGVSYGSYYDRRPRGEYLDWIEEVGREIKRVLKENGSFFLNVGGKPSDPWIPLDIIQRLRQHFTLQNVIHWIKSIALSRGDRSDHSAPADLAFGHYKPIPGRRFLNDCQEYLFHLTKTGRVQIERLAVGVPYQDKSNIGRWKAATKDKRCRGNTWFIPYETIKSREKQRPHPSTFPVKLPEMCIRLQGLGRTGVVLDPFMGLGSTALAALNLGVSCIGFEIDPQYFEVSVARLQEAARAQPL